MVPGLVITAPLAGACSAPQSTTIPKQKMCYTIQRILQCNTCAGWFTAGPDVESHTYSLRVSCQCVALITGVSGSRVECPITITIIHVSVRWLYKLTAGDIYERERERERESAFQLHFTQFAVHPTHTTTRNSSMQICE